MGYKATHDLAVATGTYESNGETKRRYENIGRVFSDEEGRQFYAIKRTFNPAGVPNPDGKEMVLVSAFPIKDKTAEPKPKPAAAEQKARPQPSAMDDDIPF